MGNDSLGLPYVLRNVKQNRLVYLDVCTEFAFVLLFSSEFT